MATRATPAPAARRSERGEFGLDAVLGGACWSRGGGSGDDDTGEPEELLYVHDPVSGLRAVVAIDSTVLGPALGGCRIQPYATPADAIADALRLGAAMTEKAAIAGLDLGGGKGVIIGDPHMAAPERNHRLRAFGKLVDRFHGRYITAEDVGTTTADMEVIATETPYVVGRSAAHGGGGDPSVATALGVVESMRATASFVHGSRDLAGAHVVVIGVGKVGSRVVEHLVAAGASVTIADVDLTAVHAVKGRWPDRVRVAFDSDAALWVACDIVSPCALGGVFDEATIETLACRMVVGSANNQLASDADAVRLADAGIVYAPDFVVNAGGLLHVSGELFGLDAARVEARVRGIGVTLGEILREADRERTTPLAVARRRARQRIASRRTLAA